VQPIIAQPGNHAHPGPDQAARQRADRLAKATPGQIETALAYLSTIDPEAFEIAFTAVTATGEETQEDEEPVPAGPRRTPLASHGVLGHGPAARAIGITRGA